MKKSNILVDVIALVVLIVLLNPAITGFRIHEYLGILSIVVFIAHVTLSLDALRDSSLSLARSFASSHSKTNDDINKVSSLKRNSSFKYGICACIALDALLLISVMVVAISGIMQSAAFLQMFGLYADGYWFWSPLHSASAKILLATIIIHVFIRKKQLLYGIKQLGNRKNNK